MTRVMVCALMLLGFPAVAQTPPACAGRTACLVWERPTQYSDGTVLGPAVQLLYTVYHATHPQQVPVPLGTTTQTRLTLTNQPLGEQCYVVTAAIGTAESEYSEPACKIMRIPAPTEGVIEAPSDGAIEPR